MASIADSLARAGSDWKSLSAPRSPHEVEAALVRIGRPLPKGLIELYRLCNSGEGSLPFQPWCFVLWEIESAAETRENEHYRKYYDQLVFFGSSGAGVYFGLDQDGRVFVMDPIAGEESIVVVAESFDEFAGRIGFSPPDGLPAADGV